MSRVLDRPRFLAAAGSLLLVLAVAKLATAATPGGATYIDSANDLAGGPGPDIRAVTISNTRSSLTLRVRFGASPPLRYDEGARLEDFLSVRLDVPPIGTPRFRGGSIGDFVITTSATVTKHADVDDQRGRILVVPARVLGSTVSFSVPLRSLRDPPLFRFAVVAAREGRATDDEGMDLLPDRGMLRYKLHPR